MTPDEPRNYLADAQTILAQLDRHDPLVPMWALTAHLAALRDYYESREYTDEVIQNILGGEAAARDYAEDLL